MNRDRVRFRLLVLLWIWAACMFLLVDLFRNVPEFDGLRPDADWYRAARYAAHRMAGEPWVGDDPPPVRVPRAATVRGVKAWDAWDEKAWDEAAESGGPDLLPAAKASLRAAFHATAPYRGGTGAMRVAARFADADTCELFLRLLDRHDTVVAKLPLTERRDDLDFVRIAVEAVQARGSTGQRERLKRWVEGDGR